ncbi:MAG: hypothetical protein KC621_29070 [Myxococcales bacterium]|nr:hypothetical protein [Myxococcales bacterium]
MSRSVCVRCGGERERHDQVCPSCGHRPDGDGLFVAWLLSTENLSEAELDGVRDRIRSGEVIRPTERMLARARRALGADFASDAGLDTRQRMLVLATSLLLTPLPGLIVGVWWWNDHPRAARQALALSLPASLGFFLLVLYLRSLG